jgi:flagellar biosynthesis anti-sigma factor FlgM
MEIESKPPASDAEVHVKKTQAKEKKEIASKQSSQASLAEDKVVLSPKAKQIGEAKRLLNAVPEIREEKVARIKKKIKNGTYRIDGKEVAAKMIKETFLNEVLLEKPDK